MLMPHCSRMDTTTVPELLQGSVHLCQEAHSSVRNPPSLHRTRSPLWLYPLQSTCRLLWAITPSVDTLSKLATFLASTSLSLLEVQVPVFGHFHGKDTPNFCSILPSRVGHSFRPHGIVCFHSPRPRERRSSLALPTLNPSESSSPISFRIICSANQVPKNPWPLSV